MEKYLNKKNSCFYHITTYSFWLEIENIGISDNNKNGISVLRTMDTPIINSVISLQLGTPEVKKENDFVLIRIPQELNRFRVSDIQPDIVFEWTWPLHNNIVVSNIPINSLQFVERFSIPDWDIIAMEDFNSEAIYTTSELYLSSFDLVYRKNERNYKINNKKEYIYL